MNIPPNKFPSKSKAAGARAVRSCINRKPDASESSFSFVDFSD